MGSGISLDGARCGHRLVIDGQGIVEMSLINQMLKDIDKRQGVNATTFSDTAGIRLEATRQSASPAKRVWLWGGLALMVAGGAYALRQWTAPVSAQTAAPAPAVASPAPAAPAVAAPVEPVAAVVNTSAAVVPAVS